MGKTALVLGATGLIGKALVEQLSNQPTTDQIVALTRRPVTYPSKKVINEVVDFDHPEKSIHVLKGDFLFSCLGTTLKQAGSIQAQRKVDVDYQFEAARLAAQNGVPHYLLVSSSMADAKSRNEYLKMKGELEEKVLAIPFQRVSVFQPSLLLGDRPENRPGEKWGARVLPALALIPGLRRYRPIYGHQVATKMIQVSQASGPKHEWFQLDEVFPT
ncbi:MAG: NAD(P)H-binding protein [Bdellovibrionales bacterium]